MKICFVTNNLKIKNGGGRFSLELIEQVRQNIGDANIKVLTAVASSYPWETAILAGGKIKVLPRIFKIRKILRAYDIIHIMDVFPYGMIVGLAAWGLKKKIIITAVGSGSIQPLHKQWSFLAKHIYNRADIVTAISHYTAAEIKKKMPTLDISVINPGINYNHFIQLKNKSLEPKNLYGDYILSVGRIKPRKGYEYSLKVFAKIALALPQLKYIIVGSERGEYFSRLQSLIGQLGLGDKVIFKEGIADQELVNLYVNAKIFILLSQNVNYDVEGFGLVFVEAAALGVPTIGSKYCGAEDAIANNKNGWLVEPQNIDQIAGKLLELLNNQEVYNNFRKSSLEFAQNFDWPIIIKKYLKIYELLFQRTV